MERINFSNSLYYEPADVLIGVREPFNKNTLWIHPHNGIVEIKIFSNGWKIISTTEDKGLSPLSSKYLNNLIKTSQQTIINKLKKLSGNLILDYNTIFNKLKELESKIEELENKITKLTKRYLTINLNLKKDDIK